MGSILIVNGADFSKVALDKVEISNTINEEVALSRIERKQGSLDELGNYQSSTSVNTVTDVFDLSVVKDKIISLKVTARVGTTEGNPAMSFMDENYNVLGVAFPSKGVAEVIDNEIVDIIAGTRYVNVVANIVYVEPSLSAIVETVL